MHVTCSQVSRLGYPFLTCHLLTGIERMISLFAMLGFCLGLAILMFGIEWFVHFGIDSRIKARARKKSRRLNMMDEFKRKNDKIWETNLLQPWEISRKLRSLANDIEISQ
jgi:hypothetical protein